MKGKGNWALINDSDYTPISQGAVVIKQSKRNNLQADKFYKFLFSNEAKIILKDFGYSVDE
jgi:molybdate transport system substrate-binding protein